MPKRWEYMTLDCAALEDLNELGGEGWECLGKTDVLMPDAEGEEESQVEERVLLFRREVE